MATAYLTDKASSTVPAKSMPSGVVAAVGSYTLSAALVINDTIQGPSIPANAYLLDVIIDTPDLDSNGSPAVVLEAGISGSASKFISASTVGQAGGIQKANVAGTVGYSPTSDTPVIVKVSTAPATSATSGTIKIALLYSMDE